KGLHGSIQSEIGVTGIHPAIKRKTDDTLNGGAGHGKYVHRLLKAPKDEPRLLQYLPSVTQLKERKPYLRKEQKEHVLKYRDVVGWELKTVFAILMDLSTPCHHEYQQAELQQSQHACIVADRCLANRTVEAYRVIMTSQFMLQNMIVAIDTQGSNVSALIRGVLLTLRSISSEWISIGFGAHIPSYSMTQVSACIQPMDVIFCPNGNAYAFKRMFSFAVKCAQTFFARTLLPRFGSPDHSATISQAIYQVRSGITLLNRYPHLLRNARSSPTIPSFMIAMLSLIIAHFTLPDHAPSFMH
ncbi:TPA: LOW QUALITY PROTEIN: hypothetical protein N0F65_005269, partial [Lagenidium giganteum]